MDLKTREKISRALRGSTQSSATKRKRSLALRGQQSNFAGKEQSKDAKDLIKAKRGNDSRVDGLKWIVNRLTDKTFRKRLTPSQKFQYGRKVKREIKEFKEFIKEE